MAYHVLHLRTPHYSFSVLRDFYNSTVQRHRVVKYYATRAISNLKMLEELNFVGRTSEFARLYGILFHEVVNRGSIVDFILLCTVSACCYCNYARKSPFRLSTSFFNDHHLR